MIEGISIDFILGKIILIWVVKKEKTPLVLRNGGGMILPILQNKLLRSMITLEDFQCSSFEKKCDWVIGYSNFLASRILGSAKVYLYHSDDFFIEVYYSTTYKKVLMINAFNSI